MLSSYVLTAVIVGCVAAFAGGLYFRVRAETAIDEAEAFAQPGDNLAPRFLPDLGAGGTHQEAFIWLPSWCARVTDPLGQLKVRQFLAYRRSMWICFGLVLGLAVLGVLISAPRIRLLGG